MGLRRAPSYDKGCSSEPPPEICCPHVQTEQQNASHEMQKKSNAKRQPSCERHVALLLQKDVREETALAQPLLKKTRVTWSQDHLLPGISFGYLSNWENGRQALEKWFILQILRVAFTYKGSENTFLSFDGLCSEMQSCPVQIKARVYFDTRTLPEVKQFGEHVTHAGGEIGFGACFSAALQTVADQYKETADHTTLCAANLLSEWRVADIPEQDWPDAKTVSNWIYREKEDISPGRGASPTAEKRSCSHANPPRSAHTIHSVRRFSECVVVSAESHQQKSEESFCAILMPSILGCTQELAPRHGNSFGC